MNNGLLQKREDINFTSFNFILVTTIYVFNKYME